MVNLYRPDERFGESGAGLVARLPLVDQVFFVDKRIQTLELEGQPIHLTASEFRILATLARNAGQVMSSRELIHIALGYPLNEAEATEIIKVHVRHLRQKIEPDRERPRYVLTVRGLGYMLNRNEMEDTA